MPPGAPGGPEVKAGLLAGRSFRAIARALGISRQAVQQHAKRLLLRGELVKVGGKFVAGVAGGRASTPEHPPAHPPASPDHPSLAPPARIDVATDTRATFRVTVPPAIVDRVPGFVISKPKGQVKGRPVRQMLHHVAHTDPRGRTWNLWLDQSLTTGKWSLWTGRVAPAPRLEEFQKHGETPQDAVERLARAVVEDWAQRAGVAIVFVKMSRPVAVTLPGTIPPGMVWRDGETTADGTPPHPNGWNTLELQGNDAERTRVQQVAHLRLPETTATVEQLERLLARLVGLHGQHAAVEVGLTERLTHLLARDIAAAGDGVAARPSPSVARPPSPWEFI